MADEIKIISRVVPRRRDGAVLPGKSVIQQTGGAPAEHTHPYLPAMINEDGSYTVNISKVLFKGSVIAEQEVSAYGAGGSGGTGGSFTIVDDLLSSSTDAALSANQGRVLKGMIDEIKKESVVTELAKLKDVMLGVPADGDTLKYDAAQGKWINSKSASGNWKDLQGKPEGLTDENIAKWVKDSHQHVDLKVLDTITAEKVSSWNKVVVDWNKAFYFDEQGNLHVRVDLIGDLEVSAYGKGSGTGGSGSFTIVDNLLSTSTDAALSANQGRVLREMIQNKSNATTLDGLTDVTLSNLSDGQILKYNAAQRVWVNGDGTKVTWDNIEGKPASLTDININSWIDASKVKHSHSNKSVLDGISSAKVSLWDEVVANWNKAFYFDSSNNLRVKVNVVGEKEVSAYGAGTSSGGGSFTIVDALTSTSRDAALSANMGRVLKELIDNKSSVTHWNDLQGKPSWIGTTKPSYTWEEISNKPTSFTPSTHNHPISQITGLQAALDNKSNINHTHNQIQGRSISDLNSPHWDNLTFDMFNGTAANKPESYNNANGVINVSYGTHGTSGHYGFQIAQTNGGSRLYFREFTAGTPKSWKGIAFLGDTIEDAKKLGGIEAKNYTPRYYFDTHNKYICLGTLNTTQNGNSAYFDFYTGNGYNAGAEQGKHFTLFFRTSNGSTHDNGKYYTAEYIAYNADSYNVYIIQNSQTSYTFWMGKTNYVGYSIFEVKHTSNSSFKYSGQTADTLPTNAVAVKTKRLLYDNESKIKVENNSNPYYELKYNGESWYTQISNGLMYLGKGTANSIRIDGSGNLLSSKHIECGKSVQTNGSNSVGSYPQFKFHIPNVAYAQFQLKPNLVELREGSSQSARYYALAVGDFTSNGNIVATGEVTAYSDVRLKSNIQTLGNRGYITPIKYEKDGKESIGFSAQEVRELYPELVHEDAGQMHYLSVNYSQYVAVLQAQVIELQQQIDELKKK